MQVPQRMQCSHPLVYMGHDSRSESASRRFVYINSTTRHDLESLFACTCTCLATSQSPEMWNRKLHT